MKALIFSGKTIYALPFAIFGLGHLTAADSMVAAVPSFVPGGIFWVYFTGVAMLAAAVSIISGKLVKLSSILLAVLLFVYAVTIMLPGMGSANEQIRQMSFIGFMKDVSMAGAALFIAGIAGSKKE